MLAWCGITCSKRILRTLWISIAYHLGCSGMFRKDLGDLNICHRTWDEVNIQECLWGWQDTFYNDGKEYNEYHLWLNNGTYMCETLYIDFYRNSQRMYQRTDVTKWGEYLSIFISTASVGHLYVEIVSDTGTARWRVNQTQADTWINHRISRISDPYELIGTYVNWTEIHTVRILLWPADLQPIPDLKIALISFTLDPEPMTSLPPELTQIHRV